MLRLLKLAALLVLLVALLLVFGVVGAAWIVQKSAAGRIVYNPSALPKGEVALVLGTSPTGGGHYANPHFEHRIAAAAELFRLGRVKRLLLSGDNGRHGYNEPREMQRALLALGVPESAMTLDYAGFRTLDSMVRAAKVFGQKRLIIVTDRFHTARSVFLARHFGIDAVAFPSREVEMRYSYQARVREWFARVKACLDVYVLHTQPHFLGKPEKLPAEG